LEKRDDVQKIVFTGPECSGKTTLSNAIAKKLNAPLVKEYAREYLNNLDREYSYPDLLKIAKGQLKLEKNSNYSKSNSRLIICDTNLQVIKIWSQVKYFKCDPFILKNQDRDAFYILCYPDFNWENDPLREHPKKRMMLFDKYYNDLKLENYNFIVAKGSLEARISLVFNHIKDML
tara:strand:+ start:250 stop:777 length:528 start_codon:yes stop_codon:yes gene_type:complete